MNLLIFIIGLIVGIIYVSGWYKKRYAKKMFQLNNDLTSSMKFNDKFAAIAKLRAEILEKESDAMIAMINKRYGKMDKQDEEALDYFFGDEEKDGLKCD